jgi:hypothetical protein
MALITCKECQKEFSTDAKRCPNCGANSPVKQSGFLSAASSIFKGIFILIVLGIGSQEISKNAPQVPIAVPAYWLLCALGGYLYQKQKKKALAETPIKNTPDKLLTDPSKDKKKLYYTILAVFIGLILLGRLHEGPSIAGSMSSADICDTTGYLLSQKLGDKYRFHVVPCSAVVLSRDRVEITGGYIPPFAPPLFNGEPVHYIAHGTVNGDSLTIEEIKIIGVDNKFVSFSQAFF